MAGASDDDEMNYWPGFVDALSTMTMMLIFLMLILSLVLVSVSQNVSRAQIETIAKAAKINMAGSSGSIESITAQILTTLSRLSQNQTENNVSQSPEQSVQSSPSQPTETRIISERQADVAALDGSMTMVTDDILITLVFQPRALKPDDEMVKKFSDFITANKPQLDHNMLDIQALANTNSGQVTEARRLAYYRAMVARQMLIDAKIDPKLIRVKVIDVPSDDQLDYVKILSHP